MAASRHMHHMMLTTLLHHARRNPNLLAALTLLAAIALVFAQTANFEFINWDDPVYVTENPMVLAGLSWDRVTWGFTTQYYGLWHPLAWLSHMLDVSLWGRWAGGHHLSSVLIHAAAAYLLFRFWFEASGRFWPALAIALLFAIHPTRAESVAWVSERKDVLCAFFMIATLFAWQRWRRGGRAAALGAALGLYALALLAKPMAVSLPLLLLLVDRWPLRTATAALPLSVASAWQALKPVLPFALLAAVVMAITLWPQGSIGFSLPQGSAQLSRMQGAQVPLAAAGAYLLQFVWPVSLSFFHPFDVETLPARALAASLALLVLAVAAYRWRRERPWIAFGLAWFLITLLPVSGIVRIGSYEYADRYTYLPFIGLFVALVFSIAERATDVTARRLLAAGLAVAATAGVGYWQVSHWRDSGTLSARALAIDPDNIEARLMRAKWLAVRDPERGIETAQSLLASKIWWAPQTRSEIMLKLGDAHHALGDASEAQAWWKRAIEVYPKQWRALAHPGSAALAAGRYEEAAILLAQALLIYPLDAETLVRYGLAVERLGNRELALGTFRRAVELEPHFAEARGNAERLAPR